MTKAEINKKWKTVVDYGTKNGINLPTNSFNFDKDKWYEMHAYLAQVARFICMKYHLSITTSCGGTTITGYNVKHKDIVVMSELKIVDHNNPDSDESKYGMLFVLADYIKKCRKPSTHPGLN